MIRTSGAIAIITALQMATESFAVPKSVMNTIAGREIEGCAGATEPFCGDCGFAQPAKVRMKSTKIP